jgi:hypothetical protein
VLVVFCNEACTFETSKNCLPKFGEFLDNAPSVADKVTNVFDDFLTISFKENSNWQFFCWNATTDPGKKGVQQFHNKKGVARLVPNQYRTTWAVDKHQGKYDALCQRLGNVTVWRDANKDLVFEINCEPYLSSKHKNQDLEIYYNNMLIKKINFEFNKTNNNLIKFELKKELITNNNIELRFYFKNPGSPSDYSESPDSKKLGILLKNIFVKEKII